MRTAKFKTLSKAESWTVGEIRVTYNPNKEPLVSITNSNEAYSLLLNIWDMDTINLQENLIAVYLNRQKEAICYRRISIGNIAKCDPDIQLILVVGLLCRASGILLAHNHPSGKLKPSKSDKWVTNELIEAASKMNMAVIDHLIVGESGYYSFADEGFCFSPLTLS